MNFKSTIRFMAALSIGATSITANAQLQLACPLNWSALADIDGPNSDRVILGVKARDWKKEYLDEMLNKEQECLQNSSDIDSIKKATLNDVRTRAYPSGLRAIEERDKRQQQAIAQVQLVADAEHQRQAENLQRQQQEVQHQAQRLADERRLQVEKAQRQQEEIQRQADFQREQEEHARKNNLWIVIAIFAAAIGGWFWNKFIRNRCPNCKSSSLDKINETEVDRWRGTKQISEKNSRGTKTRHVQATYVRKQFEYRCKHCQEEWVKERQEELGNSSLIGRFFSGY